MTDSTHTPALSGRDLARARRLEMSHTGGAKIKASPARAGRSKPAASPIATTQAASSAAESQVASSPVAPPLESIATNVGANTDKAPLTGKALSMARRAMLSQSGGKTLPASASVGRKKPSATEGTASNVVDSIPNQSEACCDACADTNSSAPCTADAEPVKTDNALDSLCEIIKSNPESAANASSNVHALCRDRRNTLAKKGKLGLPGRAGRQARKSLVRGATTSSVSGKELAKLHREDRCASGRGNIAACRPSGRINPSRIPQDADSAPDKVEIGTTLSGQSVSGTQVEQTEKVTGSEAGSCRSITGTEYLGVEQFNNLCSTIAKPAAVAPGRKAGISETSHGQLMTGVNVAASNTASKNVTGVEAGDCRAITGSEYLGAEHFSATCSSSTGALQSMALSQQKVVEGLTGKNMRITGVDEARDNAVTGSESGSAQNVTGSDYINMPQRSQSAVAPAKVGFSHTAAGLPVSGGESARTSGITGDEQDACGRVTGTEYVSSERFVSTCGVKPAVTTPAKVGVDASRGGMMITGNLVDRDKKVTGNEPGTCQRVTGNQYDSSASKGFCNQRSNKVHEMHTLHGRPLTGTEGSPSPKLTGDDRGSCSGVTGSEYVSQEYFQQSCPQTPQPSTAMPSLSRTWNNQVVSGVQTGHSQKTTGDEQGICKTVTGSNYAAREQVSEFCDASAVALSEQRMHHQHNTPPLPVSGMTPTVDPRMAGGFQRGMCQTLTGTPYQGQQDQTLCNSGHRHHLAQSDIVQNLAPSAIPANHAVEQYKADFSVMSPAKAAWQQRDNEPSNSRVHSSVCAHRSSITGAINKAEGVISGTPEFRHQREIQPVAPVLETAQPQPERITGEGSESGTQITGDDWSRGGLITGTEGLFSACRNQTQQGVSINREAIGKHIGAYALRGRERPEVAISKVTGGSGNTCTTGLVTLSGGASA